MTKLEEKVERYNDTCNFGKVKGNSTNTNVITQDVNTQDLDRLQKLEKENRKQLSTILDLDIENRTLKQAFEILKNKNVDIFELLKSKNLFDYNSLTWATYDFNGIELTEEEYNLLKEVLGNEK